MFAATKRCFAEHGLHVQVWHGGTGSVTFYHAAEGELEVDWPATLNSLTALPDVGIQFHDNAAHANEAFEQLQAMHKDPAFHSQRDVIGRRGNVVYNWTVNQYHRVTPARRALLDRCLAASRARPRG